MSRPSASVPRGCARLAPCEIASKSNRDASSDHRIGPKTASRTMTPTPTSATTPSGVRSARAQRLTRTTASRVEDRRTRVDEAERDVDGEIDHEHQRPEQECEGLHLRIVLLRDRLHEH